MFYASHTSAAESSEKKASVSPRQKSEKILALEEDGRASIVDASLLILLESPFSSFEEGSHWTLICSHRLRLLTVDQKQVK